MCGGGGGGGNSDAAEVERIRAREADEERRRENRRNRRANIKFQEAFAAAQTGGRAAVEDYYRRQGADPALFQRDIDAVIAESVRLTPKGSATPYAEFEGDPTAAFESSTDALQVEARNALDRAFPTNFEQTRFGSDLDDPIIAAIQAEDRTNAEKYLQTLFDRGVITQGGLAAGTRDLDRQANTVHATLGQYGSAAIEAGRARGRGVADSARLAGAGVRPGGAPFDVNTFSTQLDREFNDFLQNLEVNIRGNITGNLFDTSNLANVAGAAQGAGNFKYDRNALAGVASTEEDTDAELARLAPATGVF